MRKSSLGGIGASLAAICLFFGCVSAIQRESVPTGIAPTLTLTLGLPTIGVDPTLTPAPASQFIPTASCPFSYSDEHWPQKQVRRTTDTALIEEVAAIAAAADQEHLGWYEPEVYVLEHPDDPGVLYVEYDRAYRIHTCYDTTLLRRVDGNWEILPVPRSSMSSYDAVDLLGFVWECDAWSLYIASGEGYYLSFHLSLDRSRDGGESWSFVD